MKIIEKYLSKHQEDFITISQCNLKTKTWIHRGGQVNFYLEPLSVSALTEICALCYKECVSFQVVGHTSNLYFLEYNIPDVVISTKKLTSWVLMGEENIIKCQPGVIVKRLAAYCNEVGISGFSGFIDLPGTIAGATVNNSSCFGSLISDLVESCTIITSTGEIKTIHNKDFLYSHRNSIIKQKIINCVIIEVSLRVEHTSSEILKSRALENHTKRIELQEGPKQNLGSTYAEVEYKKGVSFLMHNTKRLIRLFGCSRTIYWQKYILLLFTGFIDLTEYISDKNINCFIWKDSEADAKFIRYQKFIKKISTSSRLEIEIIGNNSK